ncbi:MAG: hypothetical protein AMXMBFR33_61860 [Candidatus Xenobia bacterium]
MTRILSVGALALWLWGALSTGPPPPGPGLLLLILGAVVAELRAPRLLGYGFLSGAYLFYLAAALLYGYGWATVLVTIGLGARAALRPARSAALTGHELLLDAMPTLASLAVLQQVSGSSWAGSPVPILIAVLAAGQLYLALHMLLNTRGDRVLLRALPLRLATIGLGALVALLMMQDPWRGLWVVALLPWLWRTARLEAEQAELFVRNRMAGQIRRLEGELEETQEVLGDARRTLHEQVDAFSLLDELTARLTSADSRERVLELILNATHRIIPSQSVVIFVVEQGRLAPLRYRSPLAEKLRSWDLLGLREQAAEQAHESGQPVQATSQVFVERCVAAPIADLGVLYVGGPQTLSQRQVHLISVLARQAGVALHSVGRYQDAERGARTARKLQDWLARLDLLLEASRALSSNLRQPLEHLEQWVGAMVPHDQYELITEGPLLELLQERQAPLLLEQMDGSPYARQGMACLLAFPLVGSNYGVVVSARQSGALTREHQHLMGILAFHAGIALQNAEAHRLLQESEAQLIQSAKLAAVGQLAAGVAHEMNSPLGAVKVAISQASRLLEQRPERSKHHLTTAMTSLERAQEIVARLLYYAREGSRVQTDVDLNQVVQDSLEIVRHSYSEANIALEPQLEELPAVRANAGELQQVVLNLLVNARDAARSRVTIHTAARDDRVELRVEDDGPGVPSEVRDKIFDPFFTTKPVGRGTGLGLSVSLQIVKQHGGELVLEPDHPGAHFLLRLQGKPAEPSE